MDDSKLLLKWEKFLNRTEKFSQKVLQLGNKIFAGEQKQAL